MFRLKPSNIWLVALSLGAFEAEAAWVRCAVENATCTFPGTAQVRYGTGTTYITKTFTGSVACKNSVFGDPAYGLTKACDYETVSSTATPTPAPAGNWTFCASERSNCSFSGTAQVKFGTVDKFVVKTFTNGVACNNSVFGDPAYGLAKSCWTSIAPTTATPTPAPTATPASTPAPTAPTAGTGGGPVGPSISTFKASGPIVLKSGDVITGLSITNPNGPCIDGNNVSNVRIYNNKIGPCAESENGVGVRLQNSNNVQIDHNSFDDVSSALYAYMSGNNIVFDHNYATRIRGPMPRGQLVQFNNASGTGIKITCNVSDLTSPGYTKNGKFSGPEDQINLYYSRGTAASPIQVSNNKLRGGGPSTSGGGILGSDGTSQYVTVSGNILVDPGQYGIAAAGGQHIKLQNNKIYSGTAYAWNNIGMYAWNQYSGPCTDIDVSGNRVSYKNKGGGMNSYWNGGNCSPITQTNNTWNDSSLSAAIWNETIDACK